MSKRLNFFKETVMAKNNIIHYENEGFSVNRSTKMHYYVDATIPKLWEIVKSDFSCHIKQLKIDNLLLAVASCYEANIKPIKGIRMVPHHIVGEQYYALDEHKSYFKSIRGTSVFSQLSNAVCLNLLITANPLLEGLVVVLRKGARVLFHSKRNEVSLFTLDLFKHGDFTIWTSQCNRWFCLDSECRATSLMNALSIPMSLRHWVHYYDPNDTIFNCTENERMVGIKLIDYYWSALGINNLNLPFDISKYITNFLFQPKIMFKKHENGLAIIFELGRYHVDSDEYDEISIFISSPFLDGDEVTNAVISAFCQKYGMNMFSIIDNDLEYVDEDNLTDEDEDDLD